MHESDWLNLASCAEARHDYLYDYAQKNGKKINYGNRTLCVWGELHNRALRELETCLFARAMADKQSKRSINA